MADVLGTQSLGFCLSEKVFFPPSLLKDNLQSREFKVSNFFFFQYFILLCSLLACILSEEILDVILVFVLL